ncbi:MAG: hypothetical protein JWO67_2754 [Streptosporangiaceae bacterium]|nr:hypothetical protein [Streptosporangiaceae bacterium]
MKAELEARLKNLPEAKVKAKVVLDPKSVERVRAQLASLGPFTTTINVDADTAAAMATLLALRDEADRMFGRSVNVNVGANTSRARSALFQLGIQMAVLAAIPLGATVAAGIGAIAASATGAGLGLAGMAAVAVPGVSRIREALQRQKAAQNDVTAATRTGTVAVNASAIAALQAQLSAQQMATAERQLTHAQQSARQAQSDLNAARREAARGLVDMHNQAVTSALSLRSDEIAVERARMALDQLTSSRQDALAVQRAQLNLAKAQENLKGVQADPNSMQLQKDLAKLAVDAGQEAIKQAEAQAKAHELDRREAQLAYDQAVQRLKQQQLAYKRMVVDERAAARAGVEGSQQVRAAKQQLQQALEGVANAQRGIRSQQIQDRINNLQQADALAKTADATGQVSAAQAHRAGHGAALAGRAGPAEGLAGVHQGLPRVGQHAGSGRTARHVSRPGARPRPAVEVQPDDQVSAAGTPPLHPEQAVRPALVRGRPTADPASRPSARSGHARLGGRSGHEGDLGDAPAQLHGHHRRHLHLGPAGRGPERGGGGRGDGPAENRWWGVRNLRAPFGLPSPEVADHAGRKRLEMPGQTWCPRQDSNLRLTV